MMRGIYSRPRTNSDTPATAGAPLSPLAATPDASNEIEVNNSNTPESPAGALSPLAAAPDASGDLEAGNPNSPVIALSPLPAAPNDAGEFEMGTDLVEVPLPSAAPDASEDLELGDKDAHGQTGETGGGKKTAAQQRAESGEDRMKIRPASWTLACVLWGSLLGTVILGLLGNMIVLACILVFLIALYYYAKMCRDSGTRQFVATLKADMGVQEYLQQLQTTTPIIRFNAVCWHIETHYRTVTDYHTDSNGRMYTTKRTESYEVEVVTHTAAESYPFTAWEDATIALSGTDLVPLTKLHLSKELGFLSEAGRDDFVNAYEKFCADNKKDAMQIFTNKYYIPGFKERILCVKEEGKAPWWVGSFGYWTASLLLMNVPYRLLLDWNTGIVRHTMVKNIDATDEGEPMLPDESFNYEEAEGTSVAQ